MVIDLVNTGRYGVVESRQSMNIIIGGDGGGGGCMSQLPTIHSIICILWSVVEYTSPLLTLQ